MGSIPTLGSQMARNYSRFAHIEEKRNIRRAFSFLLLTGVTLILLFFFGLPLVIKFAAFFSDIRKSTTPIEITDSTPPAPPQIENLPEATNEKSLDVSGKSESGATVFVFLGEERTEVVANDEGVFTTKLTLKKGENSISSQARDKAGNEGQKTQEFKVVYDNDVPKIEITSPADGSEFIGSKNQRVTITGTCSADATLTINERFVSVSDDGSFSSSVNLSDGENKFLLKAVDKAGNQEERNLTLKYTP